MAVCYPVALTAQDSVVWERGMTAPNQNSSHTLDLILLISLVELSFRVFWIAREVCGHLDFQKMVTWDLMMMESSCPNQTRLNSVMSTCQRRSHCLLTKILKLRKLLLYQHQRLSRLPAAPSTPLPLMRTAKPTHGALEDTAGSVTPRPGTSWCLVVSTILIRRTVVSGMLRVVTPLIWRCLRSKVWFRCGVSMLLTRRLICILSQYRICQVGMSDLLPAIQRVGLQPVMIS